MSIWTHVNSSIRLNSLSNEIPYFGIEARYDDDFDKCDIPCGSEGSLIISTWVNPSKSSMAKFTVNIFGDLRDYEDIEEILNYFNKIVIENNNYTIRNGILSIEVEGQKELFFKYNYDNNKFELVNEI